MLVITNMVCLFQITHIYHINIKHPGALHVMERRVLFRVYIVVNPIAVRKSKIVYNFGFSECSRVY